jgi:sugar lactone lactonase YvrE
MHRISITTNQNHDEPVDMQRNDKVLLSSLHRRDWFGLSLVATLGACCETMLIPGCVGSNSPDKDASDDVHSGGSRTTSKVAGVDVLVWGKLGLADGRFQKPRAMVIDSNDCLYIVDKTGRIQVFDADGNFLRKWHTPAITNGKPTGLGINRENQLMVADTHYFRILFYTLEGVPLPEKTIGGTNGPNIGQFAFVTDVLQDRQGNYFISEYGEFDRIQKYSADGKFVCRFGETGNGPLQFSRPQSMVLDSEDNLWISDACNHRIQVVRCESERPELVRILGRQGSAPGEFQYPYGIHLGIDNFLYVAEFGNHRIQKLDLLGVPVAQWGAPGRNPGQLDQPWTLAQDSLGRLHVLDSANNRVQRFRLGE